MSLIPHHPFESTPRGVMSTPFPASRASAFMPTGARDLSNLCVVHHGGYTDICLSPATDSINQVAYKIFRVVPTDSEAVSRTNSMIRTLLLQQSQINRLEHDRISSIWIANITIAGAAVPAIAFPWYRHGDVLAYLQHNPDVNKLNLVIDLARGLAALHSINIVHSNLHPGNVVITDNGRACITDIGIYAAAMPTLHGSRLPIPPQWSYKSPEELVGGICTSHTDVYSFACTAYALYTGHCPVKCNPHAYAQGIQQIIERGHGGLLDHSKLAGQKGVLWTVLMLCWDIDPTSRPTMQTVEDELKKLMK